MEFRRGLFRSLPGRRAEEVGRIVQQFVVAAAFNVDLPGGVSRATSSVGEPAIQRALLDFVMALVAVLAVAIIVEWIVRRVLERPRKAVESRSHERPIVKLTFLFVRTIIDLLPVLAFALVAHPAMAFLELGRA